MASGEDKATTFQRKTAKAKANFSVIANTLEEHEALLRAKEVQLGEAMERLRSLEKKTATKVRELWLVLMSSANAWTFRRRRMKG